MRVTDDVIDGLVRGQDDGVGGGAVQAADLADRFEKGPGQDKLAQIAGKGKSPGRGLGGHWLASGRRRGGSG